MKEWRVVPLTDDRRRPVISVHVLASTPEIAAVMWGRRSLKRPGDSGTCTVARTGLREDYEVLALYRTRQARTAREGQVQWDADEMMCVARPL